jgi:predicted nucleic acid-binding protein
MSAAGRTVVIVDTNIIVAGLISADPQSPVARVLEGMLTAAFPYALSEALLGEYRTVLMRPAIRKLHALSTQEVEQLLFDLALHAIVLRPQQTSSGRSAAPDAGDQFLWDLLATRPDLVLISGDKRLRGDETMRGRVRSARALVETL